MAEETDSGAVTRNHEKVQKEYDDAARAAFAA